MANNLTIYPFTYKIGTSISLAFPGAYIVRGSAGANGIIPIYTSMTDFTANGMTEILNDKDALIILLPGFYLELYTLVTYGGTSYPYNNISGTDILYRSSSAANTASSCKLYHQYRTGFKEVSSTA